MLTGEAVKNAEKAHFPVIVSDVQSVKNVYVSILHFGYWSNALTTRLRCRVSKMVHHPKDILPT